MIFLHLCLLNVVVLQSVTPKSSHICFVSMDKSRQLFPCCSFYTLYTSVSSSILLICNTIIKFFLQILRLISYTKLSHINEADGAPGLTCNIKFKYQFCRVLSLLIFAVSISTHVPAPCNKLCIQKCFP